MTRICALLLLALLPLTCPANTAGAVNELRLRGCDGIRGASAALRESADLDEAAGRLSRGASLHEATRAAGYLALASTAVHITNVPTDRATGHVLAERFCAQIMSPDWREIGVHRRGTDVWIIAAAAFSPPSRAQRESIARRVLALTNLARSHPRACGRSVFPAAPPLSLAPALERAALEHSQDMATHADLDHIGHDRSTPGERITRAGFAWRLVGENIASGVPTPEEAVEGWLHSPPHCENIMTAGFTQMGIAYAANVSSSAGIYWTQVFATPR